MNEINKENNVELLLHEEECCICYEIIGKTNNCTTECGHKFCFRCITISLQRNHNCPCCRTPLIEQPLTNQSLINYDEFNNLNTVFNITNESFVFYDSDDEREYLDNSIENKACVDDVVKRLEQKNITMIDVVSHFDNRYNSKTAPYQPSRCDADIYFIETIGDTIEDIFMQADKEKKEQFLFEKEDIK